MSGAALVAALFFEWYGYERGPVEASASAWESLTVIDAVLALAGTFAVVYWFARKSGRLDRLELPVAPAAAVAFVGAVALALVVLRIVDLPDAAAAAQLDGRRVGTFLALAAAAGIVLGAMAALGERGEPWRRGRRVHLGSSHAAAPAPAVVRDGGSGPAQP